MLKQQGNALESLEPLYDPILILYASRVPILGVASKGRLSFCAFFAMDSMANAASAVVRHSAMVIGAAADELARQDGCLKKRHDWGIIGAMQC